MRVCTYDDFQILLTTSETSTRDFQDSKFVDPRPPEIVATRIVLPSTTGLPLQGDTHPIALHTDTCPQSLWENAGSVRADQIPVPRPSRREMVLFAENTKQEALYSDGRRP